MSSSQESLSIGMILFPRLTQLDLTGPYEVFAQMPDTHVHLIAETLDPVQSERGLSILPDSTFADAPSIDVLFVPGGYGVSGAIQDERLMTFVREQGVNAKYVTAVCTGSLVLAAAGLLDGYQATTHWLSLDLLRLFNIEPVAKRIVKDRNRITGGGVTSGIDFALFVAAELFGKATAERIQLLMEYAPDPPFNSGSPETADPKLVDTLRTERQTIQAQRRQLLEQVAKRNTELKSSG